MTERHALPVLATIPHRLATTAEMPPTLDEALRARAQPATLFDRTEQGHFRCTACAHECVIQEGRAGACGVRYAHGDTLFAPANYVARQYVRSIESNTIYHALPGTRSLIFGMFGCDLRCPYCHNAAISQALRESSNDWRPIDVSAEQLVQLAKDENCQSIVAAYNEPMIAAEWVSTVFRAAKSQGLLTGVVSDGNSTQQAMELLRPVCDVFRVDLKASTNDQYKQLGGRLEPVLASIKRAKELGYWVELVTLVVEGFNDSLVELRQLMGRVAEISLEIPWHFNAFVPRYKLANHHRTAMMTIASIVGMGYAKGFRYVYGSNAPDGVTELSHTRCPECASVLIERVDYQCTEFRLTPEGRCSVCATKIPGIWEGKVAHAGLQSFDGELP